MLYQAEPKLSTFTSWLMMLPKDCLKGAAALNRQKRLPLLLILCSILLVFIVVQAIRSIKIYIVYSSGIVPFFFIGLVLATIAVLYFRR